MINRLLAIVLSLLITSIAFSAVNPVQTQSMSVKALEAQVKDFTQKNSTVNNSPKKDSTRIWNLKDADLRSLINEISEVTGKNFVVGPNVSAKVTFISQNQLTPDELYQAFIALLRAYGFDAIPEGQFIKIIPMGTSKTTAAGILLSDAAARNGPIMVTTYRVKNYPVTDLVRVLTPLLPKYSYLEAYKPSNDLIIADDSYNIPNIIDIIRRLDQPVTQHLEIIPLQNAVAEDLAKTLNDLINTANKGMNVETDHTKMTIVADVRSNKLIVNGGSSSQRRELMTMIAQLDGKRNLHRERTEVIYLRYLPAETFAPVVQSLLDNYLYEITGKKVEESNSAKNVNSGSSSQSTPSLMGNFNLQNPLANQSTGSSSSSSSNMNVTALPRSETSKTGSSGARVQWEQSTNSVIITAPPDLIERIKEIVAQLDIRRPQVLIEAIIAECTLDNNLELGVEWRELNNQANTRFTPTNPLTTIDPVQGNYNTAGVLGAVGTGLTLGIFKNMDLHVLLRALKSDNNTNVLATPNIVTLDNEPALIKIGRRVSFAIGQIDNNPTGGNPFTSYDREDVGLTLSIKPQITPNGSIRLYVEQTLSSIIAGTERAGGNPDTSQRYIQTTVMADDGQILVLGGLLQNEWSLVDDKVPLLGDIPYLGALFKNTYRQRSKSNLMLFLRPVIIYDEFESNEVSSRKYQAMLKPAIHKRAGTCTTKNCPLQEAASEKTYTFAETNTSKEPKETKIKAKNKTIMTNKKPDIKLPSPWA